ncbi:DnaD domain protein [Iocasia frigidifontis]|uniref:DnaD domain protein n=1 Tax=Iocasia fonsfrigidae TaxID=2682810 RepID=A0A8A7KP25_9FIRM|nr:DnaD domain protein [Iocasia fonsfrigidae]QTL99804.1 DnaD domain protein [Iocasia fonsfrigidae]
MSFFINQHQRISISSPEDDSIIELGNTCIDNGFLKRFPGISLSIFFYLLTHLDDNQCIYTNATIISSYLPRELSIPAINKALKHLAEHGIIRISAKREGDYTYKIELNLNILRNSSLPITNHREGLYNNKNIRKAVIDKKTPSEEELYQAILSFIPPEEDKGQLSKWLDSFDHKMIAELIRRVDRWLERNDNPPGQAFHYLKGIVDDWYRKEIFTYQRLKHFDQLYRETRELASSFGIKKWQNVKPIHMETFKSWLSDDYPLSSSIIKLAIQEAVKRKRDGQPSLKYIEDNFIKPWKEAGIKTTQEARAHLKNSRDSYYKVNKEEKKMADNWEDVPWGFES